MPENKSHHFVPQFLLRHFASDAGGRRICLFRIGARKHVPFSSIRNQCAKDYFYGKRKTVETELSNLESDAAAVIQGVVQGESLPEPYTDGMDALRTFTMFQWARTPSAVARQEAIRTAFAREAMKTNPGLLLDEESKRTLAARSVSAPVYAMVLAGEGCAVVEDLGLKILKNTSGVEFIIGDAPVVLHNQWCRQGMGSTGLASRGLLVFLPLSPIHLAVFFDARVYSVGDGPSDFADVDDVEEVKQLNALQFAAAEHAVFYRSPETAEHVCAIPIDVRFRGLGVTSARYKEDGGKSHLVAVSNSPMNVDLKRGVLRIRHEAYMRPLGRRAQQRRPEAMKVARENERRAGRLRPKPPDKPTRYTREDD